MSEFVICEKSDLVNVADAIRGKTGGTEELTLDQMAVEIAGISGGSGGDTSIEDGLITRTLTEYANDRVTTIGSAAFYNNTTIEKVSFPNVIRFDGSNNFNGCSKLSEVYFPRLENAGTINALRGTAIREIRLPNYSALAGLPSFQNCTQLTLADFGSCGSFAPTIFGNCAALKVLIIRKSTLAYLSNVNCFIGTPLASGGTGGTVYVPSALIESYKTATNWSTLYAAGSCNFVAIEGSEYE